MIFTYLISVLLLLVSFSQIGFGGYIEQKDIAVLSFSGWQGRDALKYQNILREKISTLIIQTHRFNVINRSHLEDMIREQELQLSGMIREETAVQIGSQFGVDTFITGNFTGNSVEHHPATYHEGKKTSEAYYEATVAATINILDVESGRILDATETEGHGISNTARAATLEALDRLATRTISQFESFFSIQAFIQTIERANVRLDQGSSMGIKEGMFFDVLPISKDVLTTSSDLVVDISTGTVGTLRITRVEASSALGRLMGDYSSVQEGYLVRENKEDVDIEARILTKRFGEVTVNVGADFDLMQGSTFNVYAKENEIIDPYTGESLGFRTRNVGMIYLTDVGPNFAYGKILKGIYTIEEGMLVKERSSISFIFDVRANYGLGEVNSNTNNEVADYYFENEYFSGDSVHIDYSGVMDVTNYSVIQASISAMNPLYRFSIDGSFRYYILDELNAWTFDMGGSYNITLIPEILSIAPGVGIGCGRMGQDIPNNLVHLISDGESTSVSCWSLTSYGRVNACFKAGHWLVNGNLAWHGISFDKWEYSVKTGTNSEGNDEHEYPELPSAFVPYPEVTFGPMEFSLGIGYEF